MSQIPNTRRIIAEDYAQEYSELVGRLSYILNAHMDDVTFAVNGNLDFDNMIQNIITFNITLDANNEPVSTKQVNTGLSSPRGLNVINAVNITNNAIYPISQPFISFTNAGNGLINIENISGLPQGYKFQITLIAY